MPFRYLGVPICAKKISTAHCEALIDKMTGSIRVWSNRNMSNTTRTLLINSIVLSLHSYWSQVFVLPRKVLIGINKIYRAFLWGGHAYCIKVGVVNWEI